MKEGFATQLMFTVIPKAHPGDLDLIHAFINHSLDAGVQGRMAADVLNGPVNGKAVIPAESRAFVPSPQQIAEKAVLHDDKALAAVQPAWIKRYGPLLGVTTWPPCPLPRRRAAAAAGTAGAGADRPRCPACRPGCAARADPRVPRGARRRDGHGVRMSVGVSGDEWRTFTLQNYLDLADPYFTTSLWLTLRLAFQSMVCAVLLAIPVALAMARTESRLARRLLLAGVLLPLLVNLLLQGYGWLVMLGPAGLLNRALLAGGVIGRPLQLLYREHGVLLGLIQTAFPLAVLPLSSALRARCPARTTKAAATLGASRWQTLRHVTCRSRCPASSPARCSCSRTTPARSRCRCCSAAGACRCSPCSCTPGRTAAQLARRVGIRRRADGRDARRDGGVAAPRAHPPTR